MILILICALLTCALLTVLFFATYIIVAERKIKKMFGKKKENVK